MRGWGRDLADAVRVEGGATRGRERPKGGGVTEMRTYLGTRCHGGGWCFRVGRGGGRGETRDAEVLILREPRNASFP
jgi:hypothetical protein